MSKRKNTGVQEKDGYYLCKECGERACPTDPDKQRKVEYGPRNYCPTCKAWYCDKHYPSRWESVAIVSDSQVEYAACPKKHRRAVNE